jgi:hypothetical protein
MTTALAIICAFMAFALILFAILAARVCPIVFTLMRAQVNQAQTMNELVEKVESLQLPKLRSKELEKLELRVAKLETPAKPRTRTRKVMTS